MTSPITQPMQASKWLKSQALIDTQEMALLFESLGDFSLYMAGCVTPEGEGEISQRAFLDLYHDYISQLRSGVSPDLNRYRQTFSVAMTTTPNALFVMPVPGSKQLMRVAKPVVQLQMHSMDYSKDDGKFRSMVLGTDSMSWGIQFSYPQLFQDPETNLILKVDHGFPNTELFRKLQKWMREYTIPVPFIVDGVTIHATQRIGKKCLGWIEQHPHLKGIHVDTR